LKCAYQKSVKRHRRHAEIFLNIMVSIPVCDCARMHLFFSQTAWHVCTWVQKWNGRNTHTEEGRRENEKKKDPRAEGRRLTVFGSAKPREIHGFWKPHTKEILQFGG
jgi:hypothetical protein